MAAILSRLLILAAGLGVTEIGLGTALVRGALTDWALVLLGLVLIVAGSAGFMVTLFDGGRIKGQTDA
jgi:hypothetical protein